MAATTKILRMAPLLFLSCVWLSFTGVPAGKGIRRDKAGISARSPRAERPALMAKRDRQPHIPSLPLRIDSPIILCLKY
jgi:hypothetical protein